MITIEQLATAIKTGLMGAFSVLVLLANPAIAQNVGKPLIIPQLGITVTSSPSVQTEGLIVCLSWTDESGVPDARTELSVGDVILNANGKRTKGSDAGVLLAEAEKAVSSGKPLSVAFKKRTGPPVNPSAFVTPESRAAAQQFAYEPKFSKTVIAVDVMQELAGKTAVTKAALDKQTAEREAAKPKWHAYVPLNQFPLFAKECLGQVMRWNVCVSSGSFKPFADEAKLFGDRKMFSISTSHNSSAGLTSHHDYTSKKLTFVCDEPTLKAWLAKMPEQGFLYFTCIDAIPYEYSTKLYGTGYVGVVTGFHVGDHLVHPVDGKKHPQEQP